MLKFGTRFSWKYVMNIIKCCSVCVLDEQMKCSHYIIAIFCFEFCFVLHICLTKGYLFFLGRKYRVFCKPKYFTIAALFAFSVSIYAKQIDLPRTRRYFDILSNLIGFTGCSFELVTLKLSPDLKWIMDVSFKYFHNKIEPRVHYSHFLENYLWKNSL